MSLRTQVNFKGIVDCVEFSPNKFKRIKCSNCGHELHDHKDESIKDEHIELAIELANKSPGSLIINEKGSLFLGGMNIWDKDFLEGNKITKIINTADGLDKMFPPWARKVKQYQEKMNLKVLNLHWMDTHDQKLWKDTKWDQLIESIVFIDECVSNGENVAVHCAQGKSRSSTVVVAYIMVEKDLSVNDALKFVKSKRSLAEPNLSFIKQLTEFSKSNEFSEVKKKINS
eukprot:gene6556-10719_t